MCHDCTLKPVLEKQRSLDIGCTTSDNASCWCWTWDRHQSCKREQACVPFPRHVIGCQCCSSGLRAPQPWRAGLLTWYFLKLRFLSYLCGKKYHVKRTSLQTPYLGLSRDTATLQWTLKHLTFSWVGGNILHTFCWLLLRPREAVFPPLEYVLI